MQLETKLSKNLNKLESLLMLLLKHTLAFIGVSFIVAFSFGRLGLTDILWASLAAQLVILFFAFILYDFKLKSLFKEIIKKVDKKAFLTGMIVAIIMVFALMSIEIMLGFILEGKGLKDLTLGEPFSPFMIVALFVAPFAEELAFRAGLKRHLVDKGGFSKQTFIVISAILFSLIHINSSIDFSILITHLGTGYVFASLYAKEWNLHTSISAHFFYNLILITMALIF